MKAEQTLSDVGKSLVYNVGLRRAFFFYIYIFFFILEEHSKPVVERHQKDRNWAEYLAAGEALKALF